MRMELLKEYPSCADVHNVSRHEVIVMVSMFRVIFAIELFIWITRPRSPA